MISRRGIARALGAAAALVGAGSAVRAQTASTALAPPADDRLELIELMARYAWAYDTADAAALAATFTADGELEVFGNVLAGGALGFAGFFEQARAMRGDQGWQHLADHHLFREYDGRSCTIASYYTMAQGDAAGGNVAMRAMGYYLSRCTRTPAGWRFARRSVVRWNGQAPVRL